MISDRPGYLTYLGKFNVSVTFPDGEAISDHFVLNILTKGETNYEIQYKAKFKRVVCDKNCKIDFYHNAKKYLEGSGWENVIQNSINKIIDAD